MSLFKKFLGVAFALVLVVAIVVFFSLSSEDGMIETSVEAVGTTVLAAEVAVNEVEFAMDKGRGELKGVVIKNPMNYSEANFMSLPRATILLQEDARDSSLYMIEELTLDGAMLTLEHVGLNNTNADALLENIESFEAYPLPEGQGFVSDVRFVVRNLNIVNTKMFIVSPQVAPITVPVADIILKDLGSSAKPLTAEELAAALMKPLLGHAKAAFEQELKP